MMLSILGLLGGACFAWAAVPAAFECIRYGKNVGIPKLLAWFIFTGTILLYLYLYLMYGFNWVIAFNYSVEGWSWATVLMYTYFPRKA